MEHCVQRCASLLRFRKTVLKKEVYLQALQQDGLCLEFLQETPPGQLRPVGCADPDLVETAVRQNGMALAFACEKLRHDVQIVSEALRNNERAIKFVSSKGVICQLVQERPSALKHAAWTFRDDVEVVNIAYASDTTCLIYAGTEAALEMLKIHGLEVLKLLKPSIHQDERVLQLVQELQVKEGTWSRRCRSDTWKRKKCHVSCAGKNPVLPRSYDNCHSDVLLSKWFNVQYWGL